VLNNDADIHILKDYQLVPALAIGLHGFVLIDGLAHTGGNEGRKRQGLFASGFLCLDHVARDRDIHFC
jgi:hypothetical protein